MSNVSSRPAARRDAKRAGLRFVLLLTLAVAALIASSVRVAAPADATRAALDSIGRALDAVPPRVRTPQPHASGGFEQMAFTFPPATPGATPGEESAAITALRRTIRERQLVLIVGHARGGTASTVYNETLSADARAIERANASGSESARYKLLNAVDSDLQAKQESLGASSGGGNALGDVSVIVATIAGSGQRPGYQVLFNPIVEADATTARFPFPGPSSPTTYSLAPGWYVAWAQKGSVRTAAQDVHIVRHGATPQHVQIDVP